MTNKEVMEFNLVAWLRRTMVQNDWSVDEFAFQAGVPMRAMYRYLNGEIMPHLGTFFEMIANLGMQIDICTPLHLDK